MKDEEMGYPSDGDGNTRSNPDMPDETAAPENIMHGLQLIGEMTKEEMIAEISAHQQGEMAKMPVDAIKKVIIEFRVSQYKRRLIGEADFPPANPFGFLFGGDHSGCDHD